MQCSSMVAPNNSAPHIGQKRFRHSSSDIAVDTAGLGTVLGEDFLAGISGLTGTLRTSMDLLTGIAESLIFTCFLVILVVECLINEGVMFSPMFFLGFPAYKIKAGGSLFYLLKLTWN